MTEFPWTKSGKNLLEIINDIIEKEGGRYPLAVKIMKENSNTYQANVSEKKQLEVGEVLRQYKKRFTLKKDTIIIEKWITHTLKEIAIELESTIWSVRSRGYKLGLPKRDLTLHGKPEYCKKIKVYNPKEPVIFRSMTAAAKFLNCSQAYLSKAVANGYLVRGLKVESA